MLSTQRSNLSAEISCRQRVPPKSHTSQDPQHQYQLLYHNRTDTLALADSYYLVDQPIAAFLHLPENRFEHIHTLVLLPRCLLLDCPKCDCCTSDG